MSGTVIKNVMKSILQFLTIVFALFFSVSCNSLQHTIYYQEAKFPNDLDDTQLKFLTDSTVEVITNTNREIFKFYKIKKDCYKIDSNIKFSNSSFSYLTTDTLVVHRNKIYYFSENVKMIFNSKIR
jgi:hypothetical protein